MRSTLVRWLTVVLSVLSIAATASGAWADHRCEDQPKLDLHAVGGSVGRVRPVKMFSVLPGGDEAEIELPRVEPDRTLYCARIVEGDREIEARVLDVVTTSDATRVKLAIGDPGFGPIRDAQLILISYELDRKGKIASPRGALVESVRVSSLWFAWVISVVAVVIAYLLVVAVKESTTGHRSFDPVFLTAGYFGRASISQLQVFGFTLLILGMLIYILLRTSVLSDISTDILLLLGVSAGGTAGSKITGIMKNRVEGPSWSWLMNHGWLTDPSRDENQAKDPDRAKWGDLLSTAGTFDVYSFQLLVVSVLVAAGLATSDLDKLAEFKIPEGLLPLLGLSNVVYIGGKAATPNSITELNALLVKVRAAEQALLAEQAVTAAAAGVANDAARLAAVQAAAPVLYQEYIARAREAARSVKAIFGEDSKFREEPIPDTDLMPQFSA